MKWAGAASKPEMAIFPYTPQVIVTNDSNSNLLLGYILVTVSRPTLAKSITVGFSGTYSICWTGGVGPSREEYFQHRLFHCERLMLSTTNLVTSGEPVFDSPPIAYGGLDAEWEDVVFDNNASSATSVLSSSTEHDDPPSYSEEGYTVQDAQTISNSFMLSPGTHRLEFVFMIPPRMPSTILSHLGGIEYKLTAFMKTRGHLGVPTTTRAETPVQLVNIPTRLAQLQSSLPVNDEATFTRQIDNSWWLMVRVTSCTTFPEDTIHMSVCMSWPVRCEYDDDINEHLELLAVQMDLCESTVHRSMLNGKVLKTDMITVASSMNGDTKLLKSNNRDTLPPSYNGMGRVSEGKQSNETESEHLISAVEYEDEVRERASEQSGRIRGMFNETRKQEFKLRVPHQRNMSSEAKRVDGIHIDCRSAPLSVSHQLHITLQVLDKVTQKLHLVPFHARLVIIPEVESFLLPAYSSALQDTRVQ
ncbi:hypothetical protein IWW56_000668 [Coemansia sp. RSA 2131]|nr:hypothetical protein IWW56_000668 [Coemansia sp. RSA 2131]